MTVNEKGGPGSTRAQGDAGGAPKDKKLVDLVRAALVDPNLHTDARMNLRRAIIKILGGPGGAAGRGPRLR